MPIYAPGKRINPSIRRKDDGKRPVYASLFLTSMVDMFAILVIFLLQSFSADGEIIVLPSGLELPKAENTGTLEEAPSLTISVDEVAFEGDEIIETSEVMTQEAWLIPALQERLNLYREELNQRIEEGEILEEQVQEMQAINISADRRLPFEAVRKVIYNAGHAGFPDFRFAVFPGQVEEEMLIPPAYTPNQ